MLAFCKDGTLSRHGGLWTSSFVIHTAEACRLAKGCALLSWAVLMHSTFTGVLNVPLLPGFFKFEQSMFHGTGSSMIEKQCMLVLALSHGFQIPSKKHTPHSLQK
jgi:hypothetical protein